MRIFGSRVLRQRSYGTFGRNVQSIFGFVNIAVAIAVTFFWLGHAPTAAASERPVKIVALGDSLTAGFGLPASDSFPEKLARALKAKGIAADIVNAGVSGDTASGGLERVDWSVPDGTDAVILELGANDMLRGIDPQTTRKAIFAIVDNLHQRGIAVLVCGMLAPPNFGPEYGEAFKAIFSAAAEKYGALYYPFFLDGVVTDAKLSQQDGLHPTAAGVDIIVSRILPTVEKLIAQVRATRS
jgi:acyl-CoA thioesterase-1